MSHKSIIVWVRGEQRELCGYEATSAEADFDAGTWTFKIDADTRVGAGAYLLISCEDLRQLAADTSRGAS
jgi:hypothetical protein